jgi:hypothetical protein
MQRLLIAALAASCGGVPVLAGELPRKKIDVFEWPAYDRKLEAAVMRIVAGRIGEIRGGLAADLGPVLVVSVERAPASAGSGANAAFLPIRLTVSTY